MKRSKAEVQEAVRAYRECYAAYRAFQASMTGQSSTLPKDLARMMGEKGAAQNKPELRPRIEEFCAEFAKAGRDALFARELRAWKLYRVDRTPQNKADAIRWSRRRQFFWRHIVGDLSLGEAAKTIKVNRLTLLRWKGPIREEAGFGLMTRQIWPIGEYFGPGRYCM